MRRAKTTAAENFVDIENVKIFKGRPPKRRCAESSRPRRRCSTEAARVAYIEGEGMSVNKLAASALKIHGEDPGILPSD